MHDVSALGKAAGAYAAHGLPVFPCNPVLDKARGSKAPMLPKESAPGARDGGHWLASADAATVAQWWRRWPSALIGFPTGLRTGAVVIDLDPKDHPVETMLDALATWCGGGLAWIDGETGEIVPPAIVRTQSGGLHLYFSCRPGPYLNRANLFRGFIETGEARPVLAHVDVRGEGGYVIAPPSRMANGAAYEWLERPLKDAAGAWRLPPLPPHLARIITREKLPRTETAPAPARTFRGSGDVQRYIDKTIDGVLDALKKAPEGERNQMIFWAACRLGEFVRGGVLPAGEARGLLLASLPAGVSPGEHKAQRTIENGLANQDKPAFDPKKIQQRRAA